MSVARWCCIKEKKVNAVRGYFQIHPMAAGCFVLFCFLQPGRKQPFPTAPIWLRSLNWCSASQLQLFPLLADYGMCPIFIFLGDFWIQIKYLLYYFGFQIYILATRFWKTSRQLFLGSCPFFPPSKEKWKGGQETFLTHWALSYLGVVYLLVAS